MNLLNTGLIRFGRLLARAGWRAVAVAIGLSALPLGALAAPVFFTNDCLPPQNSEYTGQVHQLYAAGLIDLRNPIHDSFTACDPPPPVAGGVTVHSFGSLLRCEISSDGGLTYQPHQAPAQVTVLVRNSGPAGPPSTTLFDTEILQLDLSGGTLPPGVMVRESPTRASTGRTTIESVQGGYRIDSFFDIFTELSLDGGQTWMPSENGAGHVVMGLPQPTPVRKSTWGSVKVFYR